MKISNFQEVDLENCSRKAVWIVIFENPLLEIENFHVFDVEFYLEE